MFQGPRSNFEIGGGGGEHISDSILGGHKTLFLTNTSIFYAVPAFHFHTDSFIYNYYDYDYYYHHHHYYYLQSTG